MGGRPENENDRCETSEMACARLRIPDQADAMCFREFISARRRGPAVLFFESHQRWDQLGIMSRIEIWRDY